MRRIGFVVLIVFASFVSLIARFAIDPEHEQEMLMDMAYLPNGKMLGWVSGGMDDVLSDLLWLRSLRYVMDHFSSDRDYTYMYKAYDIITDLDPGFQRAYRFGSYFLSGITDEFQNARALLEKGWKNNPASWEIASDLGAVYDLHLKDPTMAGEWYAKAARIPDCPDHLRKNATVLFEEEGRLDRALAMWTGIFEGAESGGMKEIAEWNVKRVRSLMIIQELDSLVERYRKEKGKLPDSLDALKDAGLIRFVPRDAFDERFVYVPRPEGDSNKNSTVACRELIRHEVDKRISYLRQLAVAPFRKKYGRLPSTLDELVEKKILTHIPRLPYGITLDYDPVTGKLSYDTTLERYALGG
ncbi:hypothetical protein ACFL01_01560 [Planctomycetota bacterium]